jgi:predicted HicB family RNase H-like nuclease
MATQEPDPTVPKVFISYSWDDGAHKEWVKQLATRLRKDGVDVTLDRWHAAPGDQIPAFMERAVRENDFVVAVCTPRFKERSDGRAGGAGYEGDIITAYAFTSGAEKKFIPILRRGTWVEAAPTWLLGRSWIDLSGDRYSESEYEELLRTVHDAREPPPPIGHRPNFGDKKGSQASPSPVPTSPPAGPPTPQHQSSITPSTTIHFRAKIPTSLFEAMASRALDEAKSLNLLIVDVLLTAIRDHSSGSAPLPPGFYTKYYHLAQQSDYQVQILSTPAAKRDPETEVHFQIRMHAAIHEILVSWAYQDKASLNALIVGILNNVSTVPGSQE